MGQIHHKVHHFISTSRKEYQRGEFDEKDADPSPIVQFGKWMNEAMDAAVEEPHAMTLATANRAGEVSARIALLRRVDERGFAFFTNYESRKGRDLAENPRAALVFYWSELERQVRITGTVSRTSSEESDSYFRDRPRSHQLSAWVSHQSQPIADRHVLNRSMREMEHRFVNHEVPRPPHWGGFILAPDSIEFWQGRPNRLHDRLRYRREDGRWKIERLSP
jgi:pyridoxamine 5'-phosphate oxidase